MYEAPVSNILAGLANVSAVSPEATTTRYSGPPTTPDDEEGF